MTRCLARTGFMMCAALLCWEARGQAPSGAAAGAPPALRVEAGGQPYGRATAFRSGAVVLDPEGNRLAIVSGRHRPEIWKIGEDGEVLDTGYFVSTGTAGRVRVEWEKSPPAEWREVSSGVLPWKATGERFAAFRLTDWLVSDGEVTGLPYFGRDAVAFRFRAAGVLEAELEDGGKVPGRWWWSRGRLHLEVEGLEDVATYEWRALADRVGWTGDMEAPALAGPAVRPLAAARGRTPPPRSLPGAAAACPREVLARLLGSAAERSDVVSALAIEKETLALCAERQALVVEIARMERLLGEVVKKDREDEQAGKPARSVAQLATVAAAPAPPGPAQRTEVPVQPTPPPAAAKMPAAAEGLERPRQTRPAPGPARRYSWFSLLGMPGRMLAGVTDGSRSWFVAVGDELPGGARVERISGKPPGVRVSGLGLLPWTGHSPAAAAGAAARSGVRAGPAPEASGSAPGEMSTTAEAAPRALSGKARAVDGDTLEIGGTRVRLWGIDAPESRQMCRVDGREWNCGGLAAAALRSRATDLRCEPRGKDRYGRVLAVCFEGADDINAWLVSEGWALAYRRYSKAYVRFEEDARRKGRGMHRGAFVAPWEWRRGKRLEAAGREGNEKGGNVGATELPPLPGEE